MNAADYRTSERLQRTLRALREAGARGLTTRELQQATGNCNPHSDVAELEDRKNGFRISCVFEGVVNGARIHRYTLHEGPAFEREPDRGVGPEDFPDEDEAAVPMADALRAMRQACAR